MDAPVRKDFILSGVCEKWGRKRPVLFACMGLTVVSVDYDHAACRWAPYCKLYQSHPVGSLIPDPGSAASKK